MLQNARRDTKNHKNKKPLGIFKAICITKSTFDPDHLTK